MSIQPVGSVTDLVPGIGVQGVAGLSGTTASPRADGVAGTFSLDVTGALEDVQALQSRSSELAVRAVTGDLDDVHDYTIAATQANVAIELTAALRNKAVEAFTEIMRMQA